MKTSQLLRQIAMAAALGSVMLVASFHASPVPWPAAVLPALLLGLWLALTAGADPEPAPEPWSGR